ncbi:MAG: zinc ribbon domain-containing protein [Oscillospiraceae bacterium]|nr:zinc ribbon domain-containing protein [Oscillospiraceae bacterium]
MPNFEELTGKAQEYAGVAIDKVKDLAAVAAEKARAASEAAKLHMAIVVERRERDKNYRAIGEWFVSEFDGEIPGAVQDVVAAVNASNARIAELEASCAKKEAEAEDPAAPELKVCPACGAASNSNFCPDCGAPLNAEEPVAAEE